MKAFRFTLEAVRTLRQRQENDAMEEYARTLLGRQQSLERLEDVLRQVSAGWHELRARLGSGCPASEAAHAQQYNRLLEKRREECANALALAERRVNAALHAMLLARQQREIVDKYFNKQKAGHERERNRAEQKLADDLASRRAGSLFTWNAGGAPA